MFSPRRIQILILAAVSLVACGKDKDPAGPGGSGTNATVASVVVTPAAGNLVSLGATTQLTAVARDAAGATVAGKTFTWSSSAPTVATVSITGLVTAVVNGSATVTATTDGVQGTASISVAAATATIEVTPAIGELNAIGVSLPFTAVAKDANGFAISGKIFVWSSSNPLLATVDPVTGIATSVASGTTTITASADGIGGNASLTMNLTGTGTDNMLVIADVLGDEVAPGVFTTFFSVTLTDGIPPPVGAAISGATVTITNPVLGPVTLIETVPATGIYLATAASFPGGDFQLDVVSGTDNIHDVIARGPGSFTITSPLVTDIVTAGEDLTVTWNVPSQAKFAELESRDFAAATMLLDDGSDVIPGGSNPARPDQRIRLARLNDVIIAGGLLGSRLQIKLRVQIEPLVVQTPPTITTASSVLNGTINVVYSQTLTAIDGDGNYAFALANATTLPAGLTLNGATGEIFGTPTATGTTNFDVEVTSNTQTSTKVLQITIYVLPSITTTSPMPDGTVSTAYSQTLAATGGDGTYTWAMFNATNLPDGLTLNAATGEISGMPTAAGTTNFEVEVTSNGQTANKPLAITIN